MGIFFGTDGLRGKVNHELTFDTAKKVGNALSCVKKNPKVIIGSDTRVSNNYLMLAVSSGAVAGGATVIDVGIVPTAGVAYITKELNADFGVVISASHNSGEYNGIKIFSSDGYKLSDDDERALERCFIHEKQNCYPHFGNFSQRFNLSKVYEKHLMSWCEENLNGLKIVLDLANGASYRIAPKIFRSLGAKTIVINGKSDGVRINEKCGALYPERLVEKVVKTRADIGFSFDGDADRLIAVTEKGEMVDGDKILYIFAKHLLLKNELIPKAVVGTSHTNVAIEDELKKMGVELLRTDIGDKYVLQKMLEKKVKIGGEQSGHIILADKGTTGDGILTAISLCNVIKSSGKKLSELNTVKLYPQVNKNVLVKDKFRIMNSEELNREIIKFNALVGKSGRIMIRASGTEPIIRVMVESPSKELNEKVATEIAEKVTDIEKRV